MLVKRLAGAEHGFVPAALMCTRDRAAVASHTPTAEKKELQLPQMQGGFEVNSSI